MIIIKSNLGVEISRGESFDEISSYDPQNQIIYMTGSRHILRYRNGMVAIGCVARSIDQFFSSEEVLGGIFEYSPEERVEYMHYGVMLKDFLGV